MGIELILIIILVIAVIIALVVIFWPLLLILLSAFIIYFIYQWIKGPRRTVYVSREDVFGNSENQNDRSQHIHGDVIDADYEIKEDAHDKDS